MEIICHKDVNSDAYSYTIKKIIEGEKIIFIIRQ